MLKNDYRDLLADLKALLQAGVPLLEALGSLAAEGSGRRRGLASRWFESVRGGATLAEAMAACAESPEEQVALVQAGERSGTLEPILGRLVERLDQRQRAWRELVQGMAYPLALYVLAIVLPPLYLLLTGEVASYLIIQLVGLGLPLLILLLATRGWAAFSRGSAPRQAAERFCLRLPWVGNLLMEQAMGKAFELLGLLIESGLAWNESLPLVANAVGWDVLADGFREMERGVHSGKNVSEAFHAVTVFSGRELWRARLAVGEKAGSLDRVLKELGTSLEEGVRARLQRLLRLLPVLVILLVGAIVIQRLFKVMGKLYG